MHTHYMHLGMGGYAGLENIADLFPTLSRWLSGGMALIHIGNPLQVGSLFYEQLPTLRECNLS